MKQKTEIFHPAIMKKIGTNNFDKNSLLLRLAGENLVNNFVIDKNKEPIYNALLDYFHGQEGVIDLNKCVALIGKYGVGKTTVFNVFHYYLRSVLPFNQNLFIIISMEDLIGYLAKDDWASGKLVYNVKKNEKGVEYKDPRHVLINEFGFKYDIKTYGNDVTQLVEAWIMLRYDLFQKHHKATHITSNYSKKELGNIFHPRIIDRFKEMFQFIEIKGESLRK